VQEFRRWRVKNEYGWDDAKVDEALKRAEGPEVVGVETPKVASRVGARLPALPVPGTPTRVGRGKRTRARSRSPTPGPSSSKRRVTKPSSSRGLVEEGPKVKVAGTLVPREDVERELATLRQQVAEPTRKTVWVYKSHRETELDVELAAAKRELEALRRSAKGESSSFLNVQRLNSRVCRKRKGSGGCVWEASERARVQVRGRGDCGVEGASGGSREGVRGTPGRLAG
jgi:hypothetical protein